MASFIRAALCLAQQFFPFGPGQSARFKIGARPFAAVVEEADIVVGLLERLDLGLDEGVEFTQIGLKVGGNCEVH